MLKAIFKVVPSFRSGVGQMTTSGLKEVSAKRITINKKSVDNQFKKLNNHDGLITYDDDGRELVTMFTSQKDSKKIVTGKTGKEQNHLVTEKDNIASNKNRNQYLSEMTLKFENDTCKATKSEKAIDFTSKHATEVTGILNSSWKRTEITVYNINDKE